MIEATSIHESEVVELVSRHPDGIRLGRFMEIVDGCFGRNVVFHTCSAGGMDLDQLLRFLEARHKVRILSGVVYPGGAPARER